MNEYQTIKEVASTWGITQRRVQFLCSNGDIPGAVKFGRSWAIPKGIERPIDRRVTTGQYRNWRQKYHHNH